MDSGSFVDAPQWFIKLVKDVWDADDWHAWHNLGIPALAKCGFNPSMLVPMGVDPDRPIAITVEMADGGIFLPGGSVRWEADGERQAVQEALKRLLKNLAAEGR